MPDDKPTMPEGTPADAANEPRSAAPPEPANEDRPPLAAADQVARELAEVKDQLLRTMAEMENLRRRTEREIADARQYAVSAFARDMLTVSDNLRRAIAAVPPEVRQSGDQALVALIEGVEVTERGLEQALAKFGIKPVEAKGRKFDPSVHQAMYEVETDAVPAGHVADVFQEGHTIGERVLRPALVGVAKPSKPAGAEPSKSAAQANGDKVS